MDGSDRPHLFDSPQWHNFADFCNGVKLYCLVTEAHAADGVTMKMHDLKMTDKENYGSGKCKSGK